MIIVIQKKHYVLQKRPSFEKGELLKKVLLSKDFLFGRRLVIGKQK